MFKDLSETDSLSALDRLFLSISLPPRGGIFGTYEIAERLFLSVLLPPRGGIFGKHDLSARLDLVSAETESGRAFFVSATPAPRGDFRVRAVTKMAARAVFFCPFEKPLAQFAFSKKKIFRSKKFLSPKIPPRGGTKMAPELTLGINNSSNIFPTVMKLSTERLYTIVKKL